MEALDISVESVRLYESGRGMPSDDVATRMVEVSGAPVLGYWHLLNKSRVAADLLPQVDTIALPQAVIQLLRRIRDFDSSHRIDRLVDIAEDGRIDQDERPDSYRRTLSTEMSSASAQRSCVMPAMRLPVWLILW